MRSRGRKAIVEWLQRGGYVVERRERHCLERERKKKIENFGERVLVYLKTESQSNG